MSEPILEAKALTKIYGQNVIFKDIDLTSRKATRS